MWRFHSFLLLKVCVHEAKVNRHVKGRSCAGIAGVELLAAVLVGEDDGGSVSRL